MTRSGNPTELRALHRYATLLRPSPIYDTYWCFAAKRQDVYFARLLGSPPPWTDDRVIRQYKFTNSYRAADRVSQFLIKHVICDNKLDLSPDDVLFRILLFKTFNKIETWTMLDDAIGPITLRSFKFTSYDRVLTKAIKSRTPIYSAAYIMPPTNVYGYQRKHRNHLMLIQSMMSSSLSKRVATCRTMKDLFQTLAQYPTIGKFLAYQFAIDINYSTLTDFREDEFVVPGPGAVDGIRKVFMDTGGISDADVIRYMCDIQEEAFTRIGVSFRNLFGRRLQYIDCQNLFCEVGKYARVAHPQYAGHSGRTRIKQKFSKSGPLPYPWFPPKWNINERVNHRIGKPNEAAWN